MVSDDKGGVEPATIEEVLAWREWSEREAIKLAEVDAGKLRRFSTERDGVPCDIEPAERKDD